MHLPDPALEMWPRRVAEADQAALVHLAVPYVRWVSLALVALLAADNNTHQVSWQHVLTQGNVLPELYL